MTEPVITQDRSVHKIISNIVMSNQVSSLAYFCTGRNRKRPKKLAEHGEHTKSFVYYFGLAYP